MVDNFRVKYKHKRYAVHLMKALKEHYTVSEDWTGSRYIGITLDWDYTKRQVHLSLPGYVKKALVQFGHTVPRKHEDSPFPHTPPDYGAKVQYAKKQSTSPALNKKEKRFVQQVCGKFLYYGRAVDSTVLTPISAIASQQANPTEETLAQTYQLLDYLATQEVAVLTFSASDMTLAVHSDASYLSEPNARSRAGGHFFLSNNNDVPTNNRAILNIMTLYLTKSDIYLAIYLGKSSERLSVQISRLPSTTVFNALVLQWTCTSADSTGGRESSITPTIGPNTTRLSITNTYVANSSPPQSFSKCYAHNNKYSEYKE